MSVNIVGTTTTGFVKLDNVVLDVWAREILLAAQPVLKFESVCVKRTELSALPGHTIKFLKYSALSGTDAITETETVTPTTLSTSTLSITATEHVKAVSMSEYLLRSAFTDTMQDAAIALGRFYAKRRDAVIRDVLSAGTNVVYSQRSGAATDRAGIGTTSYMDVNQIQDAVELLATAKAPKFGGDAYICFVHPHQAKWLRRDSAWVNIADYANPQLMVNGEIGRISDVRFIETTQVQMIKISTQDIWADNEDTGSNTSIAANTYTNVYRAIMVGDYAVGLADALPVEMRDNGIEDFGRTHSLAYYAIYGAALLETGHSVILESA